MRTFIQLVEKGRTVIGMPQSLHYNNKELERSDAQHWMDNVRQAVGATVSREKMILTWRQRNSFKAGRSLYHLLDNR